MLENTTQENEVLDKNVETQTEKPRSEKRAVISISLSADEKRRISVEALRDYSTSVSDLIRSRMFIKTENKSKTDDEEIEILKEVIQQLKAEIEDLKDKNSSLEIKHSESENSFEEERKIFSNENVLSLEFLENKSGVSIIQKINEYRSELFKKLDPQNNKGFYDFDKFSKLIFLRGLKRSYNNGMLKEDTGLAISEVERSASLEGLKYGNDV